MSVAPNRRVAVPGSIINLSDTQDGGCFSRRKVINVYSVHLLINLIFKCVKMIFYAIAYCFLSNVLTKEILLIILILLGLPCN